MGGVLDPQGPIGAAERLILINATVVMLAVIVPVIVLTLGFAWWFRAGNTRARYLPDWEYSGPVELVVWSIPALVVMFLGGMAWIGTHDLDPAQAARLGQAKPIEIQVVSLDWKWLFIYPEQGVASVNRLAVPAGTPLHFSITSAGVMNSFFVPQLGSQIYAMAGMATRLVAAGRQARHLSRPQRAVQRRRLLRHALRRRGAEPAAFDDWVRSRPRAPAARSIRRATASSAGPARVVAAVDLRHGRAGPVQAAIHRRCSECWANSPGTPSRSTSRSRFAASLVVIVVLVAVAALHACGRAGGPTCGANGSPASTTSGSASCTPCSPWSCWCAASSTR